jgi:hypothetical protein
MKEIKIRIIQEMLVTIQFRMSSHLLLKNLKNKKIYKTIMLPVVFCACETWSLAFWEEYKLELKMRVFWNIAGVDQHFRRAYCGHHEGNGCSMHV